MNDIILKNIAGKYGTPAYVYDSTQLVLNIKTLRQGIGNKAKLYYSVKANPNEYLLRLISNYVDGVEVCSVGEFTTARKSGVDADKIIFVGPGKKEEELRFVISQNIGIIVVESLQELEKINKLSKNSKVSVALRINLKTAISGSRLNMSGNCSQFGFDETEAIEVFKNNMFHNVSIEGLHFYFGTQQLDGQVINNLFLSAIKVFKRFNNIKPLRFIDFGGGFGVPYFDNERQLDFDLLHEWRNAINSDYFKSYNVFIESGRYITASCGYFLTKILYTKQINEKKFAIADGGFNNHFSLASIGRVLKRDFPVSVLNDSQDTEMITIVGPLCTPVDVIASNAMLPSIKPEDIIMMKNSGAYGYTYSPQMFLSHPSPIEILVDLEGDFKVIREAKYYK